MFQNGLRTLNPAPYFALLILFAILSGYLSIGLSTLYEYHEGLVNWYFPHGLRVTALFLLPFRHWVVFLFFSIVGSDSFYHIHFPAEEGITLNTLKLFFIYYLSEAVVGAVIVLLYKRFVTNWFSLPGIIWLLVLSMLYRFLYLVVPAVLRAGFFIYIPEDSYLEYFVAIQLAGYLVGFYFIAIALSYKWFKQYGKSLNRQIIWQYLCVVASIMLTIIAVYSLHPIMDYLLRIGLIIPLVILAYRFGGIGVIVMSVFITTVLLVYLSNAPPEQLITYQPVLISYLLIGFLVCGVMFERDKIERALQFTKSQLQQNNNNLRDMSSRMTVLNKKVIGIQEKERKILSQELHDEIGQNITALKASVYLSEQQTGPSEHHDAIKENADMMYASIYNLINWLRPSVIDQYGLTQTLQGNYFKDKLALSGIEYCPNVNIDAPLPEHIEIALFRICQEAVNNVQKHSSASLFKVTLYKDDDLLIYQLRDNGEGKEKEHGGPSGGFGLQGISDRVMTLDGVCMFTYQEGFVIDIKIPLDSKGKGRAS